MNQGQGTEVIFQGPVVPETYPPIEAAERVRPVWIPWPVAVALAPLFWILPRRFGPHFAAAGWRAAIVAHVLWTGYGAANLLVMGPFSPLGYLLGYARQMAGNGALPPATRSEVLRSPLATLAMSVAEGSSPNQVLLYLGQGVAITEVVLLVAGLAAAAYVAAGEKTGRLIGRSIRLALWASTSLIVPAMLLQWKTAVERSWGYVMPSTTSHLSWLTEDLLGALYALWMLWLILRAGSRYAGPMEGPGWQAQPIRCEACGYLMVGLRRDGQCPECGLPVADSVPEHRRPSEFASAGRLDRLPAYGRTFARALAWPGFFRHLQLQAGYPAARRFAVWTWVLTATCLVWVWSSYVPELSSWLAPDASPWRVLVLRFVPTWTAVLEGGLALAGLCTLVVSRFGRRPIRSYATVVFYGSTWILPLGVGVNLAIAMGNSICDTSPWMDIRFCWLHVHGLAAGAALCGSILLPVVLVALAVVRFVDALRAARFANG